MVERATYLRNGLAGLRDTVRQDPALGVAAAARPVMARFDRFRLRNNTSGVAGSADVTQTSEIGRV